MKTALRILLSLALLSPSSVWAGRSFNGSTSEIVMPGTGNAIDITGPQMSASCWFYLTAAPSAEVDCLDKYSQTGQGGYLIAYNEPAFPNQFSVWIYISISLNHLHSLGCSPSGSAINQWHNVVFTYQNNTNPGFREWLDGVNCANDNGVGSTGVMVSSGANLFIGSQRGNTTCCWLQGNVAEVAIWNTMLFPSQAAALATACVEGPSARRMGFPAPVGYWPMWGASGSSTEPDFSGNRLNGTITSAPQANHPPCTP